FVYSRDDQPVSFSTVVRARQALPAGQHGAGCPAVGGGQGGVGGQGGLGGQGGCGGHQGGFDNDSKFEDGQDDENNR
ncbi:hypothetical protein ACHBZF_15965, partial [Acinetobacter baumannii]